MLELQGLSFWGPDQLYVAVEMQDSHAIFFRSPCRQPPQSEHFSD